MKNIISLPKMLCVFCFAFLAAAEMAAAKKYPEAEEAFCWREIESAVVLYRETGMEAGLERIEKGYRRYEEKFPRQELTTPYYRTVWWEAQTKSGREDEEWGIKLYTYLLERSRKKNPQLAIKIPDNHYALIGNIIAQCKNTGKIAEMRKWAKQVEDALQTQRGMDLQCSSYPDTGSIFSFLPQARKHDFPMKHEEFSETAYPCQCTSYLYHPYIYGVRDVADSYLSQGDWVRSAELFQWFLDYANETLLQYRERLDFPGEMVHQTGLVTRRMADICALHGYPEEGLRFYADYVEKAEGYFQSSPDHIYNAKLQEELLRIKQGRLSEDAVQIADKAYELMSANVHYSRWNIFDARIGRVRVYHAAGRKDEAWAMMAELLALGKADITPRHRVRMLGGAIEMALADGGLRPELGDWLLEALKNERRLGNKFAELSLYEQYAEFLALNGLFDEAETIQREAVRLAKAMNLPKRCSMAGERLADLRKHRTEPEPQEKPSIAAPHSTEFIGVDLQPRRSMTATLEGEIAYGRFFLSNPSLEKRHGTLRIIGPVVPQAVANQVSWSVAVSPELDQMQLEQPITIPSGGCYMVDFTGETLPDGSGAQVYCNWLPEDKSNPSLSGYWEYEATLDGYRTTVIDAHAVKANPFYLVPIHHTLQRPFAKEQAVVDLVVCASAPVRVELYDAKTSELVYVDANGDGDFSDSGDMIAVDSNGNLWPDLTMLPGETLHSFVMYVEQNQPKNPALELRIKVLENGIWITDSIDIIE